MTPLLFRVLKVVVFPVLDRCQVCFLMTHQSFFIGAWVELELWLHFDSHEKPDIAEQNSIFALIFLNCLKRTHIFFLSLKNTNFFFKVWLSHCDIILLIWTIWNKEFQKSKMDIDVFYPSCRDFFSSHLFFKKIDFSVNFLRFYRWSPAQL